MNIIYPSFLRFKEDIEKRNDETCFSHCCFPKNNKSIICKNPLSIWDSEDPTAGNEEFRKQIAVPGRKFTPNYAPGFPNKELVPFEYENCKYTINQWMALDLRFDIVNDYGKILFYGYSKITCSEYLELRRNCTLLVKY